MAVKNQSILLTATNEGGYAPAFKGSGETYAGVDRKAIPGWQGWPIVDTVKQTTGIRKGQFIKSPVLDNHVVNFYDRFWKASGAEGLTNQALANFYFDFFFHKPGIAVGFMNDIAAQYGATKLNNTALSSSVVSIANIYPREVYAALWQDRYNHYNTGLLPASYKGKKLYYKKSKNGLLIRVKKYPETI